MVSHPLSMREALGSIPSVSMGAAVEDIALAWLPCQGGDGWHRHTQLTRQAVQRMVLSWPSANVNDRRLPAHV